MISPHKAMPKNVITFDESVPDAKQHQQQPEEPPKSADHSKAKAKRAHSKLYDRAEQMLIDSD